MTQTRPQSVLSIAVLVSTVFVGLGSDVHAGLITDWKEFTGGIPASGLDTASPVLGDGTASSAEGAQIGGQFPTVSLAVGETLTFSGSVVLTGGSDHDGGQYRFGIFNDGGQFAANSPNNWTGGWMHLVSGRDSGGSLFPGDLYQGRTDGGFLSGGGDAVALNATRVTSGILEGDSTTPFNWSMFVTRDSATTVDIFSTISGGDGNFSETMTANDLGTTNFDFTAGGWLIGGISELDQASFANMTATVPEPSGAALLGLIGLGVLSGRRRRHPKGC